MDAMREVGTVYISTTEYVADKTKIIFLEDEKEKLRKELYETRKWVANVVDAVELFIRKESKFGEYRYLGENERELLAAIGDDWKTFDLTVKPEGYEENE